MKKLISKSAAVAIILGALLANSYPAYAASRSSTIRISCTILPVLQLSSKDLFQTSQSFQKTDRETIQYYNVTAL